MSKKNAKSQEELLKEALVPVEEQPYEVPGNWVWVRLGNIAIIKRGASPRPKGDPRYFNGAIPWLKISDVSKQGKYIYETEDTVTEAGKEKSVWVDPETIILSISASVGRPAILKVGVCIHDGFVKIEETSSIIHKEFLYYFLLSALNQMLNKAKGATQININSEIVKSLAVALPPLNEQKRIADKIERLLDKINQAKQLIEEAKEPFELRRAAILDMAFRGELTINKRFSHGKAIINTGKGQSTDDGKSEELHKQLSEICPKNWLIHPLGDLIRDNTSICYGIVQTGEDTPGGVPTVRAGDLKNDCFEINKLKKVNNEIEKNYPRSRLSGNEILISIRGSVGYVGIPTLEMQGINVSREVAVIPINNSLSQRFLSYYFQSPIVQNFLKKITKGVAQQGINLNQLRTLPVPIPSADEQDDIVDRLDKLLEKEYMISRNIEDLIEDNLVKLSQTLLSKAFRGELGTNNSTEESALKSV
ncbi:restriction endonuclease subunit S [Paenibacillus sp. GCM10027629]|uniref:restriction endonuclease subunit S n=1 Tax=Paenibacillus sp. GCM10027629 TaxID=3273414 RepID=UPI00364491D2